MEPTYLLSPWSIVSVTTLDSSSWPWTWWPQPSPNPMMQPRMTAMFIWLFSKWSQSAHPSNQHCSTRPPGQGPKKTAHNQQLNVYCDKWAKQYVTTIQQLSTAFGSPEIPTAQPHLSIDGKITCQKFITTLHNAAFTPEYCSYLKKKLHWTNCDMDNVHWTVLQMALNHSTPMTNASLYSLPMLKNPLHALKAHLHCRLPLCPSCQCKPKNEWYFLECQQKDCQALFTKLKSTLIQLTQKLQLHPCLITSL